MGMRGSVGKNEKSARPAVAAGMKRGDMVRQATRARRRPDTR